MLRKTPGLVFVLIALAGALVPGFAASSESRDSQGISGRRWLRKPIIISFSISLASPPPNIKEESDVLGAARRAMQSWTEAADVQFLETSSSTETISPANAGDGVNLITISPANSAAFRSSEIPGQTRVFYDSGGAIVEADIALNPNVQFSSDGTPGTYDLESTFAHEFGHLLGLEHSAVIAATMQPRQAKNGVYGLPAITQRSLSADDQARARSLYGPNSGGSSIAGRLTTNISGRARMIFGAHVFAEDISGSVVASSISTSAGNYRLDGLRAGIYRVFGQSLNGAVSAADIGLSGNYFGLTETTPEFRSFIGSASTPSQSLNLSANSSSRLSFFVFTNPAPALTPRMIGMNAELSTAPLPLQPGETFTVYLAGENLDQLTANAISISSPLIQIDQASLQHEEFDTPFPVISFRLIVGRDVQPGDYSIRLQAADGELAYLPGALTIER
ncbi:MAG TPA: matrixin family metalloprotease [Pyrinomonadaceae bacterium]|nr:matrixin family metalloprotease [Pyrinomonadaceae bacterium]